MKRRWSTDEHLHLFIIRFLVFCLLASSFCSPHIKSDLILKLSVCISVFHISCLTRRSLRVIMQLSHRRFISCPHSGAAMNYVNSALVLSKTRCKLIRRKEKVCHLYNDAKGLCMYFNLSTVGVKKVLEHLLKASFLWFPVDKDNEVKMKIYFPTSIVSFCLHDHDINKHSASHYFLFIGTSKCNICVFLVKRENWTCHWVVCPLAQQTLLFLY